MVAAGISASLGQPVVVENKPGQAGSIGAAELARAAPDGYTVGGGTISSHAINATLYPKLPYDPLKDFAPITMLATLPNMLIVHPSVKAENVRELIALLKANPNKYSFGSAGNGTSQHISGELFKIMSGTQHAAHPVQGQRTDDPGSHRRHDPALVREHHHCLPAGEGRQAESACSHLRKALVRRARRADDGRSGAARLRHQLVAGHVCARRHAA